NRMDATTRINEQTATFAVAPANFAAPFNAGAGILAGRADEVYLTPDLWWDEAGIAAANGFPGGGGLPGAARGGAGGGAATVAAPGGMRNLDARFAGDLGASAPVYRNGNGVSGGGFYPLYYDAIQPVLPLPPGGGIGGIGIGDLPFSD